MNLIPALECVRSGFFCCPWFEGRALLLIGVALAVLVVFTLSSGCAMAWHGDDVCSCGVGGVLIHRLVVNFLINSGSLFRFFLFQSLS